MARVNIHLKRIFICLNLFFASLGVLFIGFAMLLQAVTSDESMKFQPSALLCFHGTGIIIIGFAMLGAWGAYMESHACLIAFLLTVFYGESVMLRAAIYGAMTRPQLPIMLEDSFQQLLPLDLKGEEVTHMINTAQSELQCCGLFSHTDWVFNIPDSCECTEVEDDSECKQVNNHIISFRAEDFLQIQKKSIYSEPCFPIIQTYVLTAVDVGLGIVFSLAALAGISLILSCIMICQILQPEKDIALSTVPTPSTSGPPGYQKLHSLL